VPLTNSVPLPRWNFKKANWELFSKNLDNIIQYIPCKIDCYDRFVDAVIAAAKKHIPRGYRKEYIPAWNKKCDELYKTYQESHEAA
jgi:hypothetical protein